jgi:hypothetical protein
MACHHQGFKGQTTFGPMEITSKGEPQYFVETNEGTLIGPQDFKDLPKVVFISGTNYQLGMINKRTSFIISV